MTHLVTRPPFVAISFIQPHERTLIETASVRQRACACVRGRDATPFPENGRTRRRRKRIVEDDGGLSSVGGSNLISGSREKKGGRWVGGIGGGVGGVSFKSTADQTELTRNLFSLFDQNTVKGRTATNC